MSGHDCSLFITEFISQQFEHLFKGLVNERTEILSPSFLDINSIRQGSSSDPSKKPDPAAIKELDLYLIPQEPQLRSDFPLSLLENGIEATFDKYLGKMPKDVQERWRKNFGSLIN
jgi:hypothetical protein